MKKDDHRICIVFKKSVLYISLGLIIQNMKSKEEEESNEVWIDWLCNFSV